MEAPPKKKKAGEAVEVLRVAHAAIFVSEQFLGWQESTLRALQARSPLLGAVCWSRVYLLVVCCPRGMFLQAYYKQASYVTAWATWCGRANGVLVNNAFVHHTAPHLISSPQS